ncbi:MAG: hypothetical protein HW373_533, partial [Deltaproteobacteria bacterium]|nr:hypothetical protein [Deltaproteobacteria bacterium]
MARWVFNQTYLSKSEEWKINEVKQWSG